MTGNPTSDASGSRRARMSPARIVALTVTVLLVAGVGVAAVFAARGGDAGPSAGEWSQTDAPLDPASVSPNVAAHYRYVTAHGEAYSEIPCFCGCMEFLGHRSLQDCFVRADGTGWEAHASGCGVCVAESVTARRLLNRGEDPAAVRDAVIAEFGSISGTVSPSPGR